jgi:hypothetical protein
MCEPVYTLFRSLTAAAHPTHVQAVEHGWEQALLHSEEVSYLGDELAPLLAYASLAHDTQQHHPRDVWVVQDDMDMQ